MRQVLPGDRYLICSDGLSGVVSADTIGETLREYADPQQCVERLVQLALRGGGPDNITVIVADATDQDIVEAAPIVGGAAARDRGMATSADDSTPAARASALSAPRPAGAARSRRPTGDDEPDRPPAPPGARPLPCCWCCWCSSAAASRRLELHPAAVLRRRHRATARSPSSRASRARSPGSTCPAVHAHQRHQARRPHRGRAGAGQAGHPGQERARRRAPARRADQRRPGQPEPQADLPAEPDRRPRSQRRRRPSTAGRPAHARRATPRQRRRTATADAAGTPRRPPRPTPRPPTRHRRRSTRPAAGRRVSVGSRPEDRIRDRSGRTGSLARHRRASSPAYAWPGTRRNAELSLLLLAMVLVAGVRGDGRGEPARHGHPGLLGAGRRARRGLPRRCTW